jgi:hypothetical protein
VRHNIHPQGQRQYQNKHHAQLSQRKFILRITLFPQRIGYGRRDDISMSYDDIANLQSALYDRYVSSFHVPYECRQARIRFIAGLHYFIQQLIDEIPFDNGYFQPVDLRPEERLVSPFRIGIPEGQCFEVNFADLRRQRNQAASLLTWHGAERVHQFTREGIRQNADDLRFAVFQIAKRVQPELHAVRRP